MSFKAGMAKAVITPPIGSRLSGYAGRTEGSTGVLDDLYVKTLVVDDGEGALALAVCDLLYLNHLVVRDIRSKVEQLTGIEKDRVMITCIHTHTGPDLDYMEESWITSLISQIAGAVYSAYRSMKDARIGFGAGSCLAGVSRRNPSSYYKPYFLYSDPDGSMDTTVLVMQIEDPDEGVVGILFNYPCHPVTLGDSELNISKDYLRYSHKVIENAYGPDVISIFLQGCSGNINPRWIYDKPGVTPPPKTVFPEELEKRLKETRRIGYILGGEALKAAAEITEYSAKIEIKAERRDVELPVRHDLPERIRNRVEEMAKKAGAPETRKYQSDLYKIVQGTHSITTEVQLFTIGDACIVGLPGEVFVEYQIELRKEMKYPYTFVSELANDSISYVVRPEAFNEGGYEPTVAFLSPEAGDIMIKKVLEIAR